MGLKVRFDARALADLAEIRGYLRERNPAGAERVRHHLVETTDRVADFPSIGRRTDEPGVRVLVLTKYPYLIFYAVVADEVVILHVRHGAREPLDPSTF